MAAAFVVSADPGEEQEHFEPRPNRAEPHMQLLLVMQSNGAQERAFQLARPLTVIGRSIRCDLRLPLPSVAMKQCEIRNENGAVTMNNLDQERPIFVNGEVQTSSPLADGDELKIGPVRFRVRLTDVKPASLPGAAHDGQATEIEVKASVKDRDSPRVGRPPRP